MRLPLACLAVLFLAAPAGAQEMPPLAEWIDSAEARQRPDYTYTRCAGLFLSLAKFDRGSFLPDDLTHMRDAYTNLAEAALAFRAQRDGRAPKDYLDGVEGEIGDFVDAYGQRIERSRDAGKRALDGDPSMAQDLAICRSTAEALKAT